MNAMLFHQPFIPYRVIIYILHQFALAFTVNLCSRVRPPTNVSQPIPRSLITEIAIQRRASSGASWQAPNDDQIVRSVCTIVAQ